MAVAYKASKQQVAPYIESVRDVTITHSKIFYELPGGLTYAAFYYKSADGDLCSVPAAFSGTQQDVLTYAKKDFTEVLSAETNGLRSGFLILRDSLEIAQ